MQRLALYWLAVLLHIGGWAIYYSVSRSLEAIIGFSGILLLAALETLPSALSIPSSSVAASRGYRGLLIFGFVEALGLLLFAVIPWPYSSLGVLVASIGWAIAGPHTVTAVLESSSSSSKLGVVLSSGALGWSLGGFLGPLLYDATGLTGSMLVAFLMITGCYVIFLANLPEGAASPGGSRVGALETLAYSLALSPLIVAMETSFSLIMGRIASELPSLHYALVLAGTGLTSALGKVIAGVVIDRIGGTVIYRASFAAYSIWMVASSQLGGYALAAAFLTPIFPFYEIGYYTHVSRLLGERRATAAWAASYTLASLHLFTLSVLELSFVEALIISSILAFASLVVTTLVERWITRRVAPQQRY
ncbi:hypothetical protein Pyrfu_1369 [Pyrolobus fumarii 1A]|uniref:Major facilitator superfamily MFS_1 n=1 Tax=Pyrolobus fumarii (strain DSM 11204 / 1A) TaxID=694429 RepID=G0EGS9_PYRF1|nr:hypothetical protein [Pyrolobus fumarii]AEM39227.1 hypothetical protein Pyrfu_1369 [Pyrolobus fumarii 1A]